MRIAITALLGAVALAATASLATASSLIGTPFIIDKNPDYRWTARAYDHAGGAFAVFYPAAPSARGFPQRLFFRLFDDKGAPIGSKTEIYDGRQRSKDFMVWGAGWLALKNKNTLVAIMAYEENAQNGSDTGLVGQFLEKRTPVGPRISLDKPFPKTTVGGLIRLKDGRGLAVWMPSRNPSSKEYARFVSTSGEIADRGVNITDSDGTLYDAMAFGDGFIIVSMKEAEGDYTFSYQIFGSKGEKIGIRKQLPKLDNFFPHVVGLNDGSVLVAQLQDKITGSNLTVRTYAANGRATSQRQTIRTDIRDILHVSPLPEGGFLVAISPKHDGFGNLIEVARYDTKFKQVGASVRITAAGEIKQLLTLQNGKALAVYKDDGRLAGQLIEP